MDRPTEVLEDEDVSSSMPRRFGLSVVVETQIRRFREENERSRHQTDAEVEDLIRLVIRRPDADRVFARAGRRLARSEWEDQSRAARAMSRVMPGPIARAATRRAIRRVFRKITGSGKLEIEGRPGVVRIRNCLTARADPGGEACAFYAGVLEELLELRTGRSYRARHRRCEGHGDDASEWEVLTKS